MLRKKQFEEAHKKTTNCEEEYFTKGLLYYSNEKRCSLLEEAEKLCYSQVAIARLRRFTEENWNFDSVTVDDIRELAAIEDYVHENTPAWKKNIFSRIGSFINTAE